MTRPLYESADGRFYVTFNRHSAQFHVQDTQRHGWKVVCSNIRAAETVVEKLARQHKEET